MQEKKKKIIYVLDEDACLRYIFKIERDRKIVSQLLFEGDLKDINSLAKAILCEYFAGLRHFENVLNDMMDERLFDKKTKSYIIPEKEALSFTVLFQSLVVMKEDLLKENCSLSLH